MPTVPESSKERPTNGEGATWKVWASLAAIVVLSRISSISPTPVDPILVELAYWAILPTTLIGFGLGLACGGSHGERSRRWPYFVIAVAVFVSAALFYAALWRYSELRMGTGNVEGEAGADEGFEVEVGRRLFGFE